MTNPSDVIDRMAEHTKLWRSRYAQANLVFGTWQFRDYNGELWTLHSCNDLGVPYFRRGNGKALWTSDMGTAIVRRELANV